MSSGSPVPQSAENSVPRFAGTSDRRVSILIVNYNGERFVGDCLESLAKTAGPVREVVVVENGSTDNSRAVLARYPWVHTVRSERNLGFAGGNNLGLRHCSGEYVLLLNNDTIVPPDFLEPLYGYLDKHAKVGAVQGKMILPHYGNALDVCGSFLTRFGLPYHYGYFKPDGPAYRRNFPVFSAKGACLMFRRELIPLVGGFLFDEEFFCYYEESDFCHRVWLAGYEVHFVASPAIQHFMGATSGDPHSAFVLTHYLRNMTFSLLSNLSRSSRWRILPGFFALLIFSLCLCAARLRWPQLKAHWGAITYALRHYSRIRQRRRLVNQLRRQRDGAIFAKVLKTPRLSYFWKTSAGTLSSYVDEEFR